MRHHDLVAKEPLSVWYCSTARVKRLATLPTEPALIWSAAEDGLVRYVYAELITVDNDEGLCGRNILILIDCATLTAL